MKTFRKDLQYYKFCAYGFLKNLRFFDPFIVLFFLESGLNFLQIGILYSIREITTNILEIPSGIIADVFGRRRSMIFSFASYIVSFIIFYFSSVYIAFILAMFFYSFGEAFRTGTHKAMILEYITLNNWTQFKVDYYGRTRSWSQMGSAISSLIAAFLVFYTGTYQFIFIFTAIPYILDLLLMISYPKQLDGELKKLKLSEIKNVFKITIKHFFLSIKKPTVLKAVFSVSLHSGYYKLIKDYLQPVILAFAVSLPVLLSFNDKERASLLLGGIYFIIYNLTSQASRHAGKFNKKFKNMHRPLIITLSISLILGGVSGLLYHYNFYLITIMIFIIAFVIENLRKPIGISYISDKVDKKLMTSILSFQSQVGTLTIAILAPVLGFFADLTGLGIALLIISIILLVSLPVLIKNNPQK